MTPIPTEFEELKSSGDLPSPTGVGMKILELTRTDDYSAGDMGDAIMSDPSLTGRILRLANSADKAGQEPVTTVSGAIMRLGGSVVRDLALAFSLVSEREAGACRPFDYERYWSLSLARAVAAQELSRSFGVFHPRVEKASIRLRSPRRSGNGVRRRRVGRSIEISLRARKLRR